jgi:YrbI family 3-deoxy-D-manno-octulosonate 8-phosphate phosphatase
MTPRQEVMAIIPARGGSKGIPRKNVRLLQGEPLIAHSIRHARLAKEITRIVVSTDDDEIAEISLSHGAEVVRRPSEISGDHASSESAITHVLELLRTREAYTPDLVVFLQATSPIRRPEDLDQAIRSLRATGADSLFSAARLNWFVWRVDDSAVRPVNYDHRQRPMRQTAPLDVIETGSFYIFKPWVLLKTGSRLGGLVTSFMTKFSDSMQIDDPGDFELLEQLMPKEYPPDNVSAIRLLVLDFDGVLTDNSVWVDQDGRESVKCSREDSLGIDRLLRTGIGIGVLSTETNSVVARRCAKLKIECWQGHQDKGSVLKDLLETRGIDPATVAYVGNDVNDLGCLQLVGLPIAVADAAPEVKRLARIVTRNAGGSGAVREVCEVLIEAKSKSVAGAPSTVAAIGG